MGRLQVGRAVLWSEPGRYLADNPNRVPKPGRGPAKVPATTEDSGNPETESPNVLVSSGTLRVTKALHKQVKHVALVPRNGDGHLPQGNRRSKPHTSEVALRGILEQAVQLFKVQPLISRTGEEELQFDLDPR